jgi:prepilin-type processing-associated H-X9-DG protein
LGIAIHGYALDSEGTIPYGPKAPAFTSPASFYPSTGAPTSLLSLQTGAPVGLGLLLGQYLSTQPKVLFCPGADQPLDAGLELAKVGRFQAQGSYYYRHAGTTFLFDNLNTNGGPNHLKLDDLGTNRLGSPIQALALDTQFLCPPDLAAFNVRPHTHHRQRSVSILFADGHVALRPNTNARYTVDLRDYAGLHDAFSSILAAFEAADAQP